MGMDISTKVVVGYVIKDVVKHQSKTVEIIRFHEIYGNAYTKTEVADSIIFNGKEYKYLEDIEDLDIFSCDGDSEPVLLGVELFESASHRSQDDPIVEIDLEKVNKAISGLNTLYPNLKAKLFALTYMSY